MAFAVDDELEPKRKKRLRSCAAKAATKTRLRHYCPRERDDTHQGTEVDANSKKPSACPFPQRKETFHALEREPLSRDR
jgi:hypothetical protein